MNRRIMRWVSRIALSLALGAVGARPAPAQSTIFNIPTTDTVSPKKGYFEIDYLPQAPAPEGSSWQIIMPRIVLGVSPQVEVGLNSFNTMYADGGGTYAYIQPNVKYKFFANDDQGLAAAAGIIGYVPVNKRDSSDSFGMVYGLFSKKVTDGPRFHAGVYQSLSYGDDETGGVILGYEQPLSSRASFVVDFLSGKNFWGYLTPGISIVLPRNGLLNIGYSLGNDSYEDPSNDNRALFVYYGITFP
jgi:hypothetical protein